MTIVTGKTRVLLVEDHELLRAGLRALLESDTDVEVLGETGSGEEAVELCQKLRPDVVVMDLRMAGMGGVEATRRICRSCAQSRVLALTMEPEEESLLEVIDAGATGYLRKTAVETMLLPALHAVAKGELYANDALIKSLRKAKQYNTPPPPM
ncbi:MAG TPA: response regulator transcription factor [Longimicrobiales bacterium]|nr:response regulator transcription factor [Longimicrobiales bacterium]